MAAARLQSTGPRSIPTISSRAPRRCRTTGGHGRRRVGAPWRDRRSGRPSRRGSRASASGSRTSPDAESWPVAAGSRCQPPPPTRPAADGVAILEPRHLLALAVVERLGAVVVEQRSVGPDPAGSCASSTAEHSTGRPVSPAARHAETPRSRTIPSPGPSTPAVPDRTPARFETPPRRRDQCGDADERT